MEDATTFRNYNLKTKLKKAMRMTVNTLRTLSSTRGARPTSGASSRETDHAPIPSKMSVIDGHVGDAVPDSTLVNLHRIGTCSSACYFQPRFVARGKKTSQEEVGGVDRDRE